MNWALTVALVLYAILTIAGFAVSGVPTAYWQAVLRPVLSGTTQGSTDERPRRNLLYRGAAALALAILFALLVVAMSPMGVYRLLWEVWHRGKGGEPPLPPREPAVAKRINAA
jgi:hypothetical protein